MCLVSPERSAHCEAIIKRQAAREVKGEPDPDGMRQLRALAAAYGMDIYDILLRFIRGGLTAESAQDLFQSLATARHTDAHVLGQEVAGVRGTVIGLAADRGRMLGLTELSYFRGFLAALDGTDPRYFDEEAREWRESEIARRAGMYTPKMESSASWGWVDNHEARQQFNWILGAADHCTDCPILADQSPYYRETLYTMPRESMTPCGYNCVLDGDARVTTDRGLVPIAEIVPGDMVLTHKGRYRKVKAAWKHSADGEKAIYATVNPDGSYVRTTADHRMWSEKGWVTARDCADNELLVYTIRHGDMRKMRTENAARSKGDTLLRVRSGLSMRASQGPTRGDVPKLRKQAFSGWAMGKPRGSSQEAQWSTIGGGGKASALRGLGGASLFCADGRAAHGVVLAGGWLEGVLLPLSLALGEAQRSVARGVARASQERGLHGRSAGELGGVAWACSSSRTHDARSGSRNDYQARGLAAGMEVAYMPQVRDAVLLPGDQSAWQAAQVLFAGVCRNGASLYDIEVEEDESFVVEGVVVHNCKCRVETVQGVAAFDPVEYNLVASLGLVA